MNKRKTRDEYPFWIKLSLWGLESRASAMGFFWLSVAAATACGVYGFWDGRFFFGLVWFGAALLYWLTIRWVDRYGSWE